ncbi:DUF7521 family protein [Halospeciosus flavus]|uniref:DUF7521 family protein n=1 Tax=Halospeciosus flavus TaxID=3032283 RepID=UPI0036191E5D
MQELWFVAVKLLTIALGFLIAYQAYRGYQRNNAQTLLYVAIGFVLISIGGVLRGYSSRCPDSRSSRPGSSPHCSSPRGCSRSCTHCTRRIPASKRTRVQLAEETGAEKDLDEEDDGEDSNQHDADKEDRRVENLRVRVVEAECDGSV